MDITINETKKPKKKKKRQPFFYLSMGFFVNLVLVLFEGYIIFRCLVYLRERGETLPFVTIPIPEDNMLMIVVVVLTFLGFTGMRVSRNKCPAINNIVNNDNKPLIALIVLLFFMANMFLLIFLPSYLYICTGTFENRYTDLDGIVVSVDEPKMIQGVNPFEEPKKYFFYSIDYKYEGQNYTTNTSSNKELKKVM